MPEGDTLFRTATVLHEALAGQRVTRFDAAAARVNVEAHRAGIIGGEVESVRSWGKHLLIRIKGCGTLRTHLGMRGTWHLYRSGSPWRLPAWKARVILETEAVTSVCFGAPQVEWISVNRELATPSLARLGPDLLAADPDLAEATARLRALAETEVAVALMNQTAMAGVGNVYKSEVLFACRVSPFSRVRTLDDSTLEGLVAAARRLLRANRGGGPRRTSSTGEPLCVYRRTGRPCRRCNTRIRSAMQGMPPRRTYWCPGCQTI